MERGKQRPQGQLGRLAAQWRAGIARTGGEGAWTIADQNSKADDLDWAFSTKKYLFSILF